MGIRETAPRATDEHRASLLGHLFMSGRISQREYSAGVEYARSILDYLKTIDAPEPYGADINEFSDEICIKRKVELAEARAKLAPVGRKAASVVDRVAVYGEQITSEEIPLLCQGLRELSRK